MSKSVEHLEEVTIRFAGDSGDGMQLIGTQFSDTSGFAGNEVNTFPDYPSEIRAPEGTLYGVSAFQVHFGTKNISSNWLLIVPIRLRMEAWRNSRFMP
jgi:2-oxoglutarate ferredoxin oxidoreductase subunit alpha